MNLTRSCIPLLCAALALTLAGCSPAPAEALGEVQTAARAALETRPLHYLENQYIAWEDGAGKPVTSTEVWMPDAEYDWRMRETSAALLWEGRKQGEAYSQRSLTFEGEAEKWAAALEQQPWQGSSRLAEPVSFEQLAAQLPDESQLGKVEVSREGGAVTYRLRVDDAGLEQRHQAALEAARRSLSAMESALSGVVGDAVVAQALERIAAQQYKAEVFTAVVREGALVSLERELTLRDAEISDAQDTVLRTAYQFG